MSGPENKKLDDRLLEEFLSGDGEVVRAYRAADKAVTPPALDELVLKIARDEAGRPVIVPARPVARWQRLRTPVAIAATLVFGVSVLLSTQVDRETGMALLKVETPVAAKVDADTAAEAATAPAAVAVAEQQAMQLNEAVVPAQPPAEARSRDQDEPVPSQHMGAIQAPPAPPPQAAEEKQLQDRRRAEYAYELRQDALSKRESAPPPAKAKAAAPAREPDEGALAARKAPAADLRSNRPEARGSASYAMPAAPAASALTEDAIDSRREADSGGSCEQLQFWYARIRALRDEHKLEAARGEVGNLRRSYPNCALPPDLQGLWQAPGGNAP